MSREKLLGCCFISLYLVVVGFMSIQRGMGGDGLTWPKMEHYYTPKEVVTIGAMMTILGCFSLFRVIAVVVTKGKRQSGNPGTSPDSRIDELTP